MTFKNTLAFLTLVFCNFYGSFAQKENNVWTFGNQLGIDFNSPSPTVFRSRIFAKEGCASICDPATGKLLFYSDGEKVWDSTHTVMPNGAGIIGPLDKSSTQGVAIAPVFGHPNKYYLFTLEEFNMVKSGYLRYSVIDMSLNGGKGDVMPGIKNNTLDTGMSEKMIIAPSCNGLWLITHHVDSPIFYSYKIDNPLIINRPVISNTGGLTSEGMYYVGEMKLSPYEKNIALGNWISPVFGITGKSPIEIFDFDRVTGKIANGKTIDSSNFAYSIEFSPDNSKFYVADWDSSIYQYDISLLPSTSAVLASKTKLIGDNFTSLRRGPDGKIYVNRHNYFTEISRINNPNVSGLGCNLEIDVPSLSNTSSTVYIMFGNNTLIPVKGSDTTIFSRKDTTICDGDNFSYQGDPRRNDFIWHDGNISNKRVITTAGTYWVRSSLGCTQYVDTFVINTKAKQFNFTSTNYDLCFVKDYVVAPRKPAIEFLWNDGSTAPTHQFLSSGSKWVMSSNLDCNINIDTFHVKLTNFDINLVDTFICVNDTLIFDAEVDSVATYLWNDHSTNSSLKVSKPGNYWAFVTVGKCSRKDEFIVFPKTFEVNFSSDTNICQGSSVTLEVLDKNLEYLWQDGSKGSSYVVDKKGTYTVQIKEGNCIENKLAFVDVVQCENCMHIPNAFTPNKDQINDEFRVLTACLIEKFSIVIYSRFGEEVYSSDNFNLSWDGTFKGLPLNTGTFYYLIRVKFRKPDSQEEMIKGDVTLIR